MKVFILTFELGISSGHKELIGIYGTEEMANEAIEKHMRKYCYGRHHYFIRDVELNKEISYTFAEW